MPNYYTPDTIRRMLDTYNQNRAQRNYMAVPDIAPWHSTKLQEIEYPDIGNAFNNVISSAEQATNLERIKGDNRDDYAAYLAQQEANQQAQQNYIKPEPAPEVTTPAATGGAIGNYSAKRWGADRVPEVSDIKELHPNAPIVGVSVHGMNFQVNRQVAPIFVAFVRDLWKHGYHPKSIGGYANRNIAGTSTPSLHSYGFAIDIDPTLNPVTWNGQNITVLPPYTASLAAKYGLTWGGAWNGNKRDPMHFSVKYGGTS